MMSPRVSVLMSVYNGEGYLDEAVESILNQTFRDFEFIVVDDGSTDDTSGILDTYRDARIVRLKNERNRGLVYSLNRGLAVARAELVARMDADDISHPCRLERQADYMASHHEVGVLGTWMRQVDETGELLSMFEAPCSHEMIVWKMLFECSIAHPTVMMRRAPLAEVGGYDPAFKHIEDTELWSRLIFVTRFANIPDTLFSRRWHQDSICNVHADAQYQAGIVIRRRLFERILGREVDPDLAEWFSRACFPAMELDPDQSRQVLSLMMELYTRLSRDTPLTPITVAVMRKDLARRVLSLMDSCDVRNRAHKVELFGYVLYISPRAALSAEGRRAFRTIFHRAEGCSAE